MRIVRAGRQWSVHWRAFRRYVGKLARNFDVVVDEVNTIPFFAPLWAGVPVLMFIHQLARGVWWYESLFPISLMGFLAEPWYLRIYRRTSAVTVSRSTRLDLKQLGLRGPISVIPEGLEPLTPVVSHRSDEPTFLYAGRLSPSKRVDHIIRAFALFIAKRQAGQLRLLGDGPDGYVKRLHQLTEKLGIRDRVVFLGRVSAADKHQQMADAHMLLVASAREGWGLVVTEASAYGTPSIAYDVAGLRDSVRNDVTGVLVHASPQSMAIAMLDLWDDPKRYATLSATAQSWSRDFSFERTAEAFRAALTNAAEAERTRTSSAAAPSVDDCISSVSRP